MAPLYRYAITPPPRTHPPQTTMKHPNDNNDAKERAEKIITDDEEAETLIFQPPPKPNSNSMITNADYNAELIGDLLSTQALLAGIKLTTPTHSNIIKKSVDLTEKNGGSTKKSVDLTEKSVDLESGDDSPASNCTVLGWVIPETQLQPQRANNPNTEMEFADKIAQTPPPHATTPTIASLITSSTSRLRFPPAENIQPSTDDNSSQCSVEIGGKRHRNRTISFFQTTTCNKNEEEQKEKTPRNVIKPPSCL